MLVRKEARARRKAKVLKKLVSIMIENDITPSDIVKQYIVKVTINYRKKKPRLIDKVWDLSGKHNIKWTVLVNAYKRAKRAALKKKTIGKYENSR